MFKTIAYACLLFIAVACATKDPAPTVASEVAGTYTLTLLKFNYQTYPLNQGGTITFVENGDNRIKVVSLTVGSVKYSELDGTTFSVDKLSNGTIVLEGTLGTYKDRILELNMEKRNATGQVLQAWNIKASKN